MNKARRETINDKRGVVVRFEIYTLPEKPTWDAPVKDYTSGTKILEAFKAWAAQHGGAVLDA